jgi:hypothetical protein
MKCFATNQVKKGIFLEKNAQVFLTLPSHALCLDNPTFFDVGLFFMKNENANFPTFSLLYRFEQNTRKRYLFEIPLFPPPPPECPSQVPIKEHIHQVLRRCFEYS